MAGCFDSFRIIYKNFVFRLILSVFILRKWNISVILTDTRVVKRQSLTVIALPIVEKGVITFSGKFQFSEGWFQDDLIRAKRRFFINFLKLNLILTPDRIFPLLLAIKICAGKFGWGEANITLNDVKIGLTIMCNLNVQWNQA